MTAKERKVGPVSQEQEEEKRLFLFREFAYKAKELLEAGRRLPREVIAFAERNGTAEIGKKI